MIDFMQIALDEAKKGYGMVSPNPLVGAVVVRDSEIIGRGYHEFCGGHHAEVNAVNSVKDSCAGAEIYVTLEPCSTCGRTPACTDLIIQNQLKKVYIGALDPNPRHAGRGVEILRNAGIEVEIGLHEAECKKLNAVFFKYITEKIPFVTLKMAMTLDGKSACHNGNSQWITSAETREYVQYLRKGHDAIIIGAQTARFDHPRLWARNPDGSVWKRPAKRFVASSNFSSEELKCCFPDGDLPEVVDLNSPEKWRSFLADLGARELTSLLIEGGSELSGSALKAGVVDAVEFHVAPKILGGRGSIPVIGGENPDTLDEAIELDEYEIVQLQHDFIVRGRIKK